MTNNLLKSVSTVGAAIVKAYRLFMSSVIMFWERFIVERVRYLYSVCFIFILFDF